MSTYRLSSIFRPTSVAVVGSQSRPRSVGRAVINNLLDGGFAGPVALVNLHVQPMPGVITVKRLRDLPWKPDLVVIATPPATVPAVAREAAERGAGAVAVLTVAMGEGPDSPAAQLEAVAREKGLRVLGPNCLGVIAPHVRLNASLASRFPKAGDLALISQSGAISGGLVEWSVGRSVGFSAVVSLGDALDVDFADLLDYFATDHRTRAILLYVEAIRDARKFMSAARAAARTKPVVVVKSGRALALDSAADATHAQHLADSRAIYDAAFRRAGLLQVRSLDELFSAAETLGRLRAFPGRRLAILTNGGGVGALSVDRLRDLGGTVAELSDSTRDRLDAMLPAGWSRTNPVDLVTDIDAERYAGTIEALLDDPANDALLAVNVPTVLSSAVETADAMTQVLRKRAQSPRHKPVFAVWLGHDPAAAEVLDQARIPNYPTESDAVNGFMHLVRYREAQAALMETPPSLPEDFNVDAAAARALVDNALRQGQRWLDPLDTARLLGAYGIPMAPVQHARDAEQAVQLAAPLLAGGQTVVLKILSPDIPHKSEVDGVRLNLGSEAAVREAAQGILQRARAARPQARISGLVVQSTVVRPKARELIAGIADDAVFGPVLVFGRGGTAVDVINDGALALPPLDLRLAHELIARTRVSRVLKAYSDVPAADEGAIALVLMKLAQLAADLPEVRQLDINPLLADASGVIAVDARIAVARGRQLHKGRGHPRFAIFPYPKEWERTLDLADGSHAFVRPVRPEDDAMFREFFTHVTDEDLRLRFFQSVRHFSHEFIARLTQIDYARSMALVALHPEHGHMLGAVRLHADANYDRGEYGILVRSDLKGHGIGWRLMRIMIEYARWLGLKTVEGQVLRDNRTMLAMCEHLGFSIRPDPDDPTLMDVTLPVDHADATGASP
ncbi:bifunctional acetate--CoA ligase family protein/GNAT family N-acetyltransferase [Pseudoxanthomonas indica]|uniref:Acetyltransferase n=1 Tax=Pseudoxanthomonas indica TaxID=428993 RepID=A0A1T5KLW3_9GAMM|nr:bifunctional acetate--CoA ligase family protein/GNAT family N-acetyltransferase [Pseudoxanthomonas indica]GGD50086.1 GCN5 family N-acetyltransferase [Pseudoxanthomonas indica]SKC64611.1 acetyltransferase [Pseudoxanthomonas indica]